MRPVVVPAAIRGVYCCQLRVVKGGHIRITVSGEAAPVSIPITSSRNGGTGTPLS